MDDSNERMQRDLAHVWARSRGVILEQVRVIEDASVAVVADALEAEARRDAEREAHKLAGSLGTFGHWEASTLAREAEELLRGTDPIRGAAALRLAQIAVELRDRVASATTVDGPMESGTRRHLIVVGRDLNFASALAASLRESGVTVTTARSGQELTRQVASADRPPGILIDASSDHPHLPTAEDIRNLAPGAPLFVVGATTAFTDRLSAARIGARRFFESRDDVIGVTAGILAELGPHDGDRPRVIAVEDDPVQLVLLNGVIERAGAAPTLLANPMHLWDAMASTPPALVILDIDMPGATGLELCRAIRASDTWSNVQIMIVSGNRTGLTEAAFAAGADDCVAKPWTPEELLARIKHRLARARNSGDRTMLTPSFTPVVPAAPTTRTVDIVVVDDDPTLVELLVRTFETRGYRVASVGDGGEAVRALTGNPPTLKARVVILDVGLPGEDGFTVLRYLNRAGVTLGTRVVMLTLRSSESEVVQSLELGAFDHVAKPFSLAVLVQRIKRALDDAPTR